MELFADFRGVAILTALLALIITEGIRLCPRVCRTLGGKSCQ